VLAHERLLVVEGAGEHVDVVVRTQLPRTTAAFRFKPRSFERFIGEPLNARPNSSCDMPRISRASVRASRPVSASRAAKAGSVSSRANLMLNGHTSGETSHPFLVELGFSRRRRGRSPRAGPTTGNDRVRLPDGRAPS